MFNKRIIIIAKPRQVVFYFYFYLLPPLLSRHSFNRPVLPLLAASWRGLDLVVVVFSSRLLGTRPSLPLTLNINESKIAIK